MNKHQVWIENNPKSNILDYDYDVSEKDKNIELTYSYSSDWSENIMGDICATLQDDGNGVLIKFGRKNIRLDYSEFRELKCLLLFENKEHIEIRETNILKMLK